MNMHTRPNVTIANIALLVGVSLWSAASFAQDAANSPPAKKPLDASQATAVLDPGLEADLLLLKRLDTPFAQPLTFDDASVGDVLTRVSAETGVRLLPDRHVLAEDGGWKLKSVSCVAATPRAALNAAMRSISEGLDGVRLDVASGILVITDNSGIRALRAKRVYRVGDLLRGMSEIVSGPDGAYDKGPELLMEPLMQSVDPEAWVDNGGDLATAIFVGDLLVVTASPMMQLAVEQALDAFRTGTPIEPVLWTISLYELPTNADRDSERDIVALAAQGAEVRVPEARLVSRPTLLAQPTQAASISLGTDSDRWMFEVVPRCGAGRCDYAIDIEHAAGEGADRRTSRVTLHAAVGAPSAVAFTTGEGASARRLLLQVIGHRQASAKLLAPDE